MLCRMAARFCRCHPATIDDGEIRLGPIRLEPLTAGEEAEVVGLLEQLSIPVDGMFDVWCGRVAAGRSLGLIV